MTIFEVGKPLPLPLLTARGIEECRVSFNESFFDIVYWLPGTEPSLIPVWKTSKLEYGLFVANNIPFFIINFPGKNWNFDASLNIKKLDDERVDVWLNGEGNIINLLLCDYKSNIILAQRMISITKDMSEKIRDVLEKQDEKYSSSADVDKTLAAVMNSYTTEEMMKRIKMTRL